MKLAFIVLVILLELVACGDNTKPSAPDAGVDVARACVYLVDAGSDTCCRFMPDEAAVAACAHPPPGACEHLACEQPDCSFVVVPACAPPVDAGVSSNSNR